MFTNIKTTRVDLTILFRGKTDSVFKLKTVDFRKFGIRCTKFLRRYVFEVKNIFNFLVPPTPLKFYIQVEPGLRLY